MKVQKTTPQPIYDAEQFDGVNVPKMLLDKVTGEIDHGAQWVMPELKWPEYRSASRPVYAPMLEVFTRIGTTKLCNGDWLLRDQIGCFEVWDDASFRANFTPMDMDEWAGEQFIPALTKALEDRKKTYIGGVV